MLMISFSIIFKNAKGKGKSCEFQRRKSDQSLARIDSEQFQNLSANPRFDGEVLYAMYVTGSVDSKIRFFCTQGLLYHLN